MKKIQIEQLSDEALCWAVAKVRSAELGNPTSWDRNTMVVGDVIAHPDGSFEWVDRMQGLIRSSFPPPYTDDPYQAWPIIRRSRIMLVPQPDSKNIWMVSIGNTEDGEGYAEYTTDPLGGAMRCYVANAYGDSIEVPDELVEDEEDC